MSAGTLFASPRELNLSKQGSSLSASNTVCSLQRIERGSSSARRSTHSPQQWRQQQHLHTSCRNVQQTTFRTTCKGAVEQPGYRQSENASGGGTDGPGGRGLGGSGRGDGDGDGSSHGHQPTFGWKGWRDRVAADQQFPYKVFIEQIIGVGAAVIGDMSSRPYWGIYELDFVFSTLVVGSLVNFSLMYFLAPTAGSTAASAGFVQTLFSDKILRSWGAPGGHMFQPGFSVGQRLLNFGYKGMIFALVGFGAGIMGTAISNGLLALRKKLDEKFTSQNEAPNVLLNAATWGTHMGISSNLRYQALNGIDMMMQPALGPTPFKVVTSVLRTINNVAGGISFVLLAKMAGVQSASTVDQA